MKMDVNLVKYEDELIKAWKEVVDDKSETNWALFTYEGQTYDLKLAGKGGESVLRNVISYFTIITCNARGSLVYAKQQFVSFFSP